jgi:hypothetical protein
MKTLKQLQKTSKIKMTKISDVEFELNNRISNVHTRIEKHEAVCAERWLEMLNRVKRIEHFIVATLITLVVGMGSIIFGS